MCINISTILPTNTKYTIYLFLIIPLFCVGQIEQNKNRHTQLDTLIELYKLLQQDNQIQVYRIQVSSNESLEKIQQIQKKYNKIFPESTSEIIFEAPEYKLITGISLDRKTTEKKLQAIKKKFKYAFLFRQAITMTKFKESRIN
tara:strand:- start:479 stop:910 length:432 start_codon:yes stop_codon:yes gene_type:complete